MCWMVIRIISNTRVSCPVICPVEGECRRLQVCFKFIRPFIQTDPLPSGPSLVTDLKMWMAFILLHIFEYKINPRAKLFEKLQLKNYWYNDIREDTDQRFHHGDLQVSPWSWFKKTIAEIKSNEAYRNRFESAAHIPLSIDVRNSGRRFADLHDDSETTAEVLIVTETMNVE